MTIEHAVNIGELPEREREVTEAIAACAAVEQKIRNVAAAMISNFDSDPTGGNFDRFRKANATLQELYREYAHVSSVLTRKRENYRKAYLATLRDNHPRGDKAVLS